MKRRRGQRARSEELLALDEALEKLAALGQAQSRRGDALLRRVDHGGNGRLLKVPLRTVERRMEHGAGLALPGAEREQMDAV